MLQSTGSARLNELNSQVVVQPYGRVPFPTQGICITIPLSSLAELEPHPGGGW